jgi:CubicO group peptidase (beta-lactamase class C family)
MMLRSMSTELADPEEVGIDPRKLEVFLERAKVEVESGLLPSVQVAVAARDRLVAFHTYGDASNDSRYILQSVGRNVVAAAVWKAIDDGMLTAEQRIAELVPEFGTNGKEVVTLEQVLTHSAGFPFAPLGYPKMLSRDARLEAFAKWRLDWEPGSRLQFHLTSQAWVVVELIERLYEVTFAEFLRTQIFEPLGLEFILGLPADQFDEVLAVPVATDRTSDDQEVDPFGPWYLNNPSVLSGGEPSHSIVGRAADLVMLHQAILYSGIWRKETVDDVIRIRRSEPAWGEQLYGGGAEIVNVCLGLTVSGEVGGARAPRTGSARTFGMGGAPFQMAFCDPEAGTSFAYLTNGYPMSGYDYSVSGLNRKINLANLGNDLLA